MVKDFYKRYDAVETIEEARALYKEGSEKGIFTERMRLDGLDDIGHTFSKEELEQYRRPWDKDLLEPPKCLVSGL